MALLTFQMPEATLLVGSLCNRCASRNDNNKKGYSRSNNKQRIDKHNASFLLFCVINFTKSF